MPGCLLKTWLYELWTFKGAITDNPDYELLAYCGTNLGIFDPDGTTYVAALIDDLGLSGINSANTMALLLNYSREEF